MKLKRESFKRALVVCLISLMAVSCTKKQEVLTMDMGEAEEKVDPTSNKGIGPIKSITLGALNKKMATKGKAIYDSKCLACHKFDQKVVGPAMAGITERRSPEWIMNMMLNTNEMVEKDPIVKSMIAEYMTKMTFQDLSEEDARAVLEYFRQKDGVK